jgi:hypothetical protein
MMLPQVLFAYDRSTAICLPQTAKSVKTEV